MTGRTVIITGGGKGIGKVYAEEFAKAGARVVAADIDGAAAKSVAEALAAQGLEASVLQRISPAKVDRGDGASRVRLLRRDRRAHQQRLADERAAAALVAGSPCRGMGSGHGGEPARHVLLLPRGVSGDEGARPRQDRQHFVLAGVGRNAQPAALHQFCQVTEMKHVFFIKAFWLPSPFVHLLGMP